jgi:hypothetical protein
VIDFSEKIDDEVITNMEELIENHKKMREQELQQFLPLVSPPPVTPPPVTPPPVTPTGSTMPISNKISIMEPIQKVGITADSSRRKTRFFSITYG